MDGKSGQAASAQRVGKRRERFAQFVAGAVEQALGGLGRHVQFRGNLGVAAIGKLMQFHCLPLPSGQLGHGGADNAGCVTAYDPARPFAAGNLRLARLVQSDVLAAMNAQGWQIPDGGVQPDQGLGSSLTPADLAYGHLLLLGPAEKGYVSTPSTMPGALVEPLFITDPFEGSIAASSRGQQIIAAGLARAIEQYFVPQPAP